MLSESPRFVGTHTFIVWLHPHKLVHDMALQPPAAFESTSDGVHSLLDICSKSSGLSDPESSGDQGVINSAPPSTLRCFPVNLPAPDKLQHGAL